MGGDGEYPPRNLAETIHSLIGMKAHLTEDWIATVCNILQGPGQSGITADGDVPLEPAGEDGAAEADLGRVVLKLKDEIMELQNQLNQLNCRRRHFLNDYLDLKGNIRVFCRVRPLSDTQTLGHAMPTLGSDSSNVFLKVPGQSSKNYTFDQVFGPSSSQAEVFREVEPVIKSALDGFNASIFAYGQTGTGKTFTMEGTTDIPGVVPRTIERLFNHAWESNNTYSFSFSMLEIYMGNLRDLLVAKPKRLTDPMPRSLVIQRDPSGGIEIENLSSIPVRDCSQALELYQLGCSFRSTATTNSNATSSRSHCMTRISIACSDAPERRRETSKVWLIDLGESERVMKTKAHGRRLEEGRAINLSLSALGDVISALHRKKSHIPFRNSKLTQVLKDSLGDDSKTLMLVHVSPREEDLCETICTLSFAMRVKSIHLGTEGDTKEKARKEAAMQNLQNTIDDIEGQSRTLKGEIEKLNRRIVDLTRTSSSSYDEDCSTVEGTKFEIKYRKDKSDSSTQDRSKVPRFMKPTLCSQRKCGISYGAGLVNFPIKKQSKYQSEFSYSGSSLVDLKSSFSTGNRTESSQRMSVGHCEAKTDICSRKGSPYFPDDKERFVGDIKYRQSKRIPVIPVPLHPKKRRSRWSSEDDLFLGRSSVADFQLEDRAGLVRQGSDFGGSTSGIDMQLADSSSDSFPASTSETVIEAGELTKCTETLSTLDDHADNSHHHAEETLDYDNPAEENIHECRLPESNIKTEDTRPSSTLLQFKVRKALFHSNTSAGKLRLKIVKIMLVLLIGVGLHGLGYEHDFFHGLIF